jgi:hypothetical protein
MRRFDRCAVLTIPTDELDYVNSLDDRRSTVELIARTLGVRGTVQERLLS